MIQRLGARLTMLVVLVVALATLVGADPYLRVDLGQDRNGTIWRGNSRPRLSYPVPNPGNTSLGGLEYLRVVDAKSLVPDDYEVEVNGGNATLRLASGPVVDTEALGTPLVGNGLSVMLNAFASDGDQWTFTAYNISGDNLLPWHPLHPGDPFFLSIGDFDAAGDGLQNEQLYPSDIWGQFTGGNPRVRLELVQPGMVPTSTPPRRQLTAEPDANVLMSLVNTNNVITPTSPEHPVTHQAMPWFVRFLDAPAGDENENAYVLLYPTPGGTGPHGLGYEYAGIGSIWETDTHAGATYDNDQFVSVRVDNTTGALWEPDLALYTELVDPTAPGFANLAPADLNGELPAWFNGPDTQAWEPVIYNVTLILRIPGFPPFFPDIFVYTAVGSDGYMWMDMFFDPGGLSYTNTSLIPWVAVNLDLNAPMGASAQIYLNEVSFMVRDRGAAATLWPTGGDFYVFYTNQPGAQTPPVGGVPGATLAPFSKTLPGGGDIITRPGQRFLAPPQGAARPEDDYISVTGAGPFIYPTDPTVTPPQAGSAFRRAGTEGHVGYVKAEYMYPFADPNDTVFWWDYWPELKTDFFVSSVDMPGYYYDEPNGDPGLNDRPVELLSELFDLRQPNVRVNADPFVDITTFSQDDTGVRPGARSELKWIRLENREASYFTMPVKLAGPGNAHVRLWVQPDASGNIDMHTRHWTISFDTATQYDLLCFEDDGDYDAGRSRFNQLAGVTVAIDSLRLELRTGTVAEDVSTRFTFNSWSDGGISNVTEVKYSLAKSLATSEIPWPYPGNPGNWEQPVPLTRQDITVSPEVWTVWSGWGNSRVEADATYADNPMDPTLIASATNPNLPRVENRGAMSIRVSIGVPNFQPPSGDAYGLNYTAGSSAISQLLASENVPAAYWGSLRAFSDVLGDGLSGVGDNDFTVSGDFMICPFCGEKADASEHPGECPICGAPLHGQQNVALGEDYDVVNLRVSVPQVFSADTDQNTIDLGLVSPGVDAAAPYGPYRFSRDEFLRVLNAGNVPIQVLGAGSELNIAASALLRRIGTPESGQTEFAPIFGTNLHWDPFTSTPLVTQYVGRLAGKVNSVPLRLGLNLPDPVPTGQPAGTYSGILQLSSTAGAEPLQAQVNLKTTITETPLSGDLGSWVSNAYRPRATFIPDAANVSSRLAITYADTAGQVWWKQGLPFVGGIDPNYRHWSFAAPTVIAGPAALLPCSNIVELGGTVYTYLQRTASSTDPAAMMQELWVSQEGAAAVQMTFQGASSTQLALRDVTAPAGVPQIPGLHMLGATSYVGGTPKLVGLMVNAGAATVQANPMPIGMAALNSSDSWSSPLVGLATPVIRPRAASLSYTKEPSGFFFTDSGGRDYVYLAYTGYNSNFGNEDVYLSRFVFNQIGNAALNYGRLPFARIGTTGVAGTNPRELLGVDTSRRVFWTRHLDWLSTDSFLNVRTGDDPRVFLNYIAGGVQFEEELTWIPAIGSYEPTSGVFRVTLTNPLLAGMQATIDPVNGRLQFGRPISGPVLGVFDAWLSIAYSPFTYRATTSVRDDNNPVLVSSYSADQFALFWEQLGFERTSQLMYKLGVGTADDVAWSRPAQVPMHHLVHEGDFNVTSEDFPYDNGGGDSGIGTKYWVFWTSARVSDAAPGEYGGMDVYFTSVMPDYETMIQED